MRPGSRSRRREPTEDDESLFEITGHEAITTSGMRLPLAELTAAYLASAERSGQIAAHPGSAGRLPEGYRQEAAARLQVLEASRERRRGPGRPPAYGAEHYERVATIYSQAQREGRSPTKAVAEEMAGGYSAGKWAAMKWVAKCRDLGLLPPTVKGKAAGWSIADQRPGRRRK